MAFETRKPACPLSGTAVRTVILHSAVRKQLLGQRGFACKFSGQYRVCINYWRIFQNHNFTNTEQKYMMLLPFERGMFAVS